MINWERKRQHLVITLQELGIESEILYENPQGSKNIALICHPHPLHQGTMYNKVVASLAKGVQEAGFATFRFNFPGVGQSTGQFDDGGLESQVTSSILKLIEQQFQPHKIALGGFSFGGAIASAAYDSELIAKVLIAPAWRLIKEKELFCQPTLIIHSLDDEIVPVGPTLETLSNPQSQPLIKAVLYPQSGHFFEGHLEELKKQIQFFLQEQVKEA